MTRLKIGLIATACAVVVSAGALAQTRSQTEVQGTMEATMPNAADPVSVRDLKAVHMKMMADAPKSYTGDPDVDFARSMLAHHEAGIAMARAELEHGKDGRQRQIAQKIIADQQKDIAELQAWLKAHVK